MKRKAIASVLFLVFIYIISLRGNLMKANPLNTERNQPVRYSSMAMVRVAVSNETVSAVEKGNYFLSGPVRLEV